MSDYNLSTPEGRAEVRRLARSVASACDCDDPRTMEPCSHCWQVSRTLFAALEEIERLEGELSDERAHGVWVRRECEARVDAMHAAMQAILEAAGVVTPKEPR